MGGGGGGGEREYYDGLAGIPGCRGDEEEVVSAKTMMVEGDDASNSGVIAEDAKGTFVAIPEPLPTRLRPVKSYLFIRRDISLLVTPWLSPCDKCVLQGLAATYGST